MKVFKFHLHNNGAVKFVLFDISQAVMHVFARLLMEQYIVCFIELVC